MPSVIGDDTGSGFGVEGKSSGGRGVIGRSDTGPGVEGRSNTGPGVEGKGKSDPGVTGTSDSGDGIKGSSNTGTGVSGESELDNRVLGTAKASNKAGVFGLNTARDAGNGVVGLAQGATGIGVFGEAANGIGVFATGATGVNAGGKAGPGVVASSAENHGVSGVANDARFAGVVGEHRSGGDGVQGRGNNGVLGIATTSSILGAGVRGENPHRGAAGVIGDAADGFGVVGLSGQQVATPGQHAGVIGVSNQGPGVAGWGLQSQPGIFASGSPAVQTLGDIGAFGSGSFVGVVTVIGTLTATNKQFQIDHPLDPGNKYLNHASVESSEMKTIYDGVTVLDDQGEAVVELPAWFESLNTSFRYQLTPIGAPAPDLHIAEEVSTNRFKIAGGPAKLKVCWQVTGIRHDSFARARPLIVETDKPAEEQGYFLHPEYQGHPKERGLAWVRNRDLMRRVEQLQTLD